MLVCYMLAWGTLWAGLQRAPRDIQCAHHLGSWHVAQLLLPLPLHPSSAAAAAQGRVRWAMAGRSRSKLEEVKQFLAGIDAQEAKVCACSPLHPDLPLSPPLSIAAVWRGRRVRAGVARSAGAVLHRPWHCTWHGPRVVECVQQTALWERLIAQTAPCRRRFS